jgi:hypothetical protein
MKDTAKRESFEEEGTLPLRLVDVVREDLRAFVVRSGMQALGSCWRRSAARSAVLATSTIRSGRARGLGTRRESW